MWWAQEIVSDLDRPQWTWVPFKSVGPFQFGQSVDDVAAVLGEPVSGWDPNKQWAPFSTSGIDTYYRREDLTLAAVSVDACRGPQMNYDGIRLAGRLPSELSPWIEAQAESLKDMPPGLDVCVSG